MADELNSGSIPAATPAPAQAAPQQSIPQQAAPPQSEAPFSARAYAKEKWGVSDADTRYKSDQELVEDLGSRYGRASQQLEQFQADPRYRRFQEKQADFDKWDQAEAAKQQQAQAAEAAKQQFQWKHRPTLSAQAKTYRHAIPRDPNTGRFSTPHPQLASVADELNAYEEWREYADEQYADPQKLINQIVQPQFQQGQQQLMAQVQQMIQQTVSGLRWTMQKEQDFKAQSKELWLDEAQTQPSPLQNAWTSIAREAHELWAMGGGNPQAIRPEWIDRYVAPRLEAWKAANMPQGGQQAQAPATPAQQAAAQRREPNILDRARNGNGQYVRGSDNAPPSIVSPRNSRELVAQSVAETLREAKIPTGVPQ